MMIGRTLAQVRILETLGSAVWETSGRVTN
jgi:hypothetical protein